MCLKLVINTFLTWLFRGTINRNILIFSKESWFSKFWPIHIAICLHSFWSYHLASHVNSKLVVKCVGGNWSHLCRGNANNGSGPIYVGVSFSMCILNTWMVLLFSNFVNRKLLIWSQYFTYDDAVFVLFFLRSRWGDKETHTCVWNGLFHYSASLPEWVIQPAPHWIRPCRPKGLPCRDRKALHPFTETLVCHPAISFT